MKIIKTAALLIAAVTIFSCAKEMQGTYVTEGNKAIMKGHYFVQKLEFAPGSKCIVYLEKSKKLKAMERFIRNNDPELAASVMNVQDAVLKDNKRENTYKIEGDKLFFQGAGDWIHIFNIKGDVLTGVKGSIYKGITARAEKKK